MTIHLLALFLTPLLLPQGEEAPAQSWRAFAVPSLSEELKSGPQPRKLDRGRHVVLPGRAEREPAPTSDAGGLPLSALASLLQQDAGRSRRNLRVQVGGPPLLVRGDAAALAAASEVLAGLDRSGRALEIELGVWLTPGAGNLGTRPSREVFEAAVAGIEPLGRTRLRSGEQTAFGLRRRAQFMASYDVQVASGSSVAGPAMGEVLHGKTLHLRAARAAGGRAVVLEGLLDLAELSELRVFETDRPDLGRLEQPRVPVLQVAFAGRVASGDVLCVSIAGSELSSPDWTLWIQASTSQDPSEPGPWRVRDVALLEDVTRSLPLPDPGAGLEFPEASFSEAPSLGFGAASLAQAADEASGRGARVPIVWSTGLLIAPSNEAAPWREVDDLVGLVEAQRLKACELTVAHGDLRVVLPMLDGLPARVLAGEERAQLLGYALEAATDTWIPRPEVGVAFDGVLFQGRWQGGELNGTVWRAQSAAARVLEKSEFGLARMEPRERALATRSVRMRSTFEGEIALPPEGSTPALRLSLQRL